MKLKMALKVFPFIQGKFSEGLRDLLSPQKGLKSPFPRRSDKSVTNPSNVPYKSFKTLVLITISFYLQPLQNQQNFNRPLQDLKDYFTCRKKKNL